VRSSTSSVVCWLETAGGEQGFIGRWSGSWFASPRMLAVGSEDGRAQAGCSQATDQPGLPALFRSHFPRPFARAAGRRSSAGGAAPLGRLPGDLRRRKAPGWFLDGDRVLGSVRGPQAAAPRGVGHRQQQQLGDGAGRPGRAAAQRFLHPSGNTVSSPLRIGPIEPAVHPQPRAIEASRHPAAPPALWASVGLQAGAPGAQRTRRNQLAQPRGAHFDAPLHVKPLHATAARGAAPHPPGRSAPSRRPGRPGWLGRTIAAVSVAPSKVRAQGPGLAGRRARAGARLLAHQGSRAKPRSQLSPAGSAIQANAVGWAQEIKGLPALSAGDRGPAGQPSAASRGASHAAVRPMAATQQRPADHLT